jgi:predicted porin
MTIQTKDLQNLYKKTFKYKSFLILIISGAVFADVTLYGRISAAVEMDSFPNDNQLQPRSFSVQDYGSYFGIRGTDNVYGQTAAIWQVEQRLDITSGEAYQGTTGSGWTTTNPNNPNSGTSMISSPRNVLASSDSYIGLQGDWGRVRIGNLSNTLRTNTGAIDIYNGSNANVMGTYDRALRVLPETIRYDSPSLNNVKFSAYYSANTDGNFNTGGANGNGIYQGDMNGFNNSPIIGFVFFIFREIFHLLGIINYGQIQVFIRLWVVVSPVILAIIRFRRG